MRTAPFPGAVRCRAPEAGAWLRVLGYRAFGTDLANGHGAK